MKKTLMTAMMMWGTTVWAQPGTKAVQYTVAVCAPHTSDEVTPPAQFVASQLFKRIGVNLAWHNDARFCQLHPDQAIVISYSRNTPKELHPGALAMAFPYERTHIEIFSDRLAGVGGVVREKLLGHVLAHEITHILQGSALHSDSGLMKEHWDHAELTQINDHYLSFTDLDVKLIYGGLPMRRGGGLHRGCQSVE